MLIGHEFVSKYNVPHECTPFVLYYMSYFILYEILGIMSNEKTKGSKLESKG